MPRGFSNESARLFYSMTVSEVYGLILLKRPKANLLKRIKEGLFPIFEKI